jgi:hypothetical protein
LYELGIVQRVSPQVPGPVASGLSSLPTLDGLEGKRFPQKPDGRRIHRTAGRNGETYCSVFLVAADYAALIHPTVGEAVDRLERAPRQNLHYVRQNDGVTASALNKE